MCRGARPGGIGMGLPGRALPSVLLPVSAPAGGQRPRGVAPGHRHRERILCQRPLRHRWPWDGPFCHRPCRSSPGLSVPSTVCPCHPLSPSPCPQPLSPAPLSPAPAPPPCPHPLSPPGATAGLAWPCPEVTPVLPAVAQPRLLQGYFWAILRPLPPPPPPRACPQLGDSMGLARPRDLAPVSLAVHPLHRHVSSRDSRSPGGDRTGCPGDGDWMSCSRSGCPRGCWLPGSRGGGSAPTPISPDVPLSQRPPALMSP